MNVFFIKFSNLENDKVVYDLLFEMSQEISFVPVDKESFIVATNLCMKTVKRKLVNEQELSFLVIDITNLPPDAIFIDNNFELKHIMFYIEEAKKLKKFDIPEFKSTEDELNHLLERLLNVGREKMSKNEIDRLNQLSQDQ